MLYGVRKCYITLSIVYGFPFISNSNPTTFPINLLPNGDCGESAKMVLFSILNFGKAVLMNNNIPLDFTKLPNATFYVLEKHQFCLE